MEKQDFVSNKDVLDERKKMNVDIAELKQKAVNVTLVDDKLGADENRNEEE